MVIRAVLAESVRELRAAGIETAVLDARLIIESVLNKDELYTVLHPEEEISAETEQRIKLMTARRAAHMPLAYLLHQKEFMGLTFFVEEGVLIPRPDSETLAEQVIAILRKKQLPAPRVLDIGTGSGALAVSVAYYVKEAVVDGVDCSATAVDVAQKNARKNEVFSRVKVWQCDILTEDIADQYDVILSNPPYIRPEVIDILERDVRDYEPRLALEGGADGLLYYREITKKAPHWLVCGGVLAVEIGYDQQSDVTALFGAAGFSDIHCVRDLADNPRVVVGTWLG